ncbi:DUF726 domain-containing protein [Natronolimnobius sp. AArcel1]|uniref:DUF726 domain-containing protein n=1 Tax=Natronolimnobius sp. AArcel1 TaxID=1679093 RepID=UPI0013EC8A3D|nr:DUF726 domain-containing protein [Natronolimnobius sp. AArcel1]NGM69861.1 DUF726 domain-containing protein [Natronolimnobius sp. AArcel1]
MAHNETAVQTSARRRTVLRGLGAGILAATGAGTASSVAAQSNDITVHDIRESPDATLPVVDELLVFAHGWMGSSAGPDQAATLADVLAAAGYEADETVAFVYDASTPDPDAVLEDAADAGAALADLVQTAVDEGVESIRLVGHSLGGRVVLETLATLEEGYVVDTVAPLGIAADGSMVTAGGHWYDGIANRAGEVRNYHSENDDVIQPDFGNGDDTALGAEGAPDAAATPETYTDVDVTDAVEDHGAYMSSSALGQDLATAMTDDEGPPPIGDSASAPTDPNGDGLYTDITGDGETTHDDVETLLANLEDDAVETNTEYFDFADNGTVGFSDVLALMRGI